MFPKMGKPGSACVEGLIKSSFQHIKTEMRLRYKAVTWAVGEQAYQGNVVRLPQVLGAHLRFKNHELNIKLCLAIFNCLGAVSKKSGDGNSLAVQ